MIETEDDRLEKLNTLFKMFGAPFSAFAFDWFDDKIMKCIVNLDTGQEFHYFEMDKIERLANKLLTKFHEQNIKSA